MNFFYNFLSNRLLSKLEKRLKKQMPSSEEINILLQEIKIVFLEDDVDLQVVDILLERIKKACQNIVLTREDDFRKIFLKICKKELIEILKFNSKVDFLEKKFTKTNFSKQQKYLFIGLQGSGKTTSIAKIARFLQERKGIKVLVASCDYIRPAAFFQLKELLQNTKVGFFNKMLTISQEAKENDEKRNQIISSYLGEILSFFEKKKENYDLLLMDTSGRTGFDQKLLEELKLLEIFLQPDEVILTIDATQGQSSYKVIVNFCKNIKLTGFVVTKCDSPIKGGVILSLHFLFKLPIFFLANGEELNDLEPFYPERITNRILGFGDLATLKETFLDLKLEKRTMEETIERILAGKFDFIDLKNQLEQTEKLGNIEKIMSLFPGIGSQVSKKQIAEAQKLFLWIETLINSMTYKERRHPELLYDPKIKARVIKGSGLSEEIFNLIMNRYEKIKSLLDKLAEKIKKGDFSDLNSLLDIFKGNI